MVMLAKNTAAEPEPDPLTAARELAEHLQQAAEAWLAARREN